MLIRPSSCAPHHYINPCPELGFASLASITSFPHHLLLRRRRASSETQEAAGMGVFTFVCRSSGDGWTGKQHKGELEASAATPYDLERQLVAAASAEDKSGGVQSSFTMVCPTSAVCQVVIGAVGGGAMVGGAAAGGAAASGGAATEAPKAEEKKEEEKEESEDDLGFSLFD